MCLGQFFMENIMALDATSISSAEVCLSFVG